MTCRHCGFPLEHIFLDLGSAPATNAFLTEPDLCKEEKVFPLKLFVCAQCWLTFLLHLRVGWIMLATM
jgi:hypothetical protein